MLLTITYTGENTSELGYLLYKNPYRPQKFELNHGNAYVFYPEVSNERTTAALLLDIDPIDLARGRSDAVRNGLFDYVNDRPYVSSSFLSTAISNVFGTAMTGRADEYQTLSDSPLDLTADITMLPCRGDTDMLNRVFEPLGYEVKHETGPFDIIGDIHGCYNELCEILIKLGYEVDIENCTAKHPQGRKAVFLGDLCDRGPKNIEVLRLVMGMARSGGAWCVAGNHDAKLLKKLKGSDVQLTHGLDKTVSQLETQNEEFIIEVKKFIDGLISHYVFDDGRLVVAHAGLKEKYQGRGSGRVREFCLYGDTTGEVDEYGFPVRLPWANEYRGKALVVYGHTPVPHSCHRGQNLER